MELMIEKWKLERFCGLIEFLFEVRQHGPAKAASRTSNVHECSQGSRATTLSVPPVLSVHLFLLLGWFSD